MSASNIFFPDHGLAEVKEAIAPRHMGQIFFQCTYWQARCADSLSELTFPAGSYVQVVGRDGLVQLIRAE